MVATEALARSGRASGGRSFLEEGISRGEREQGGGMAVDIIRGGGEGSRSRHGNRTYCTTTEGTGNRKKRERECVGW